MSFEHHDRGGSGTFYGTLQQIGGGLTNASIKIWKGQSQYFEQWWFWERGRSTATSSCGSPCSSKCSGCSSPVKCTNPTTISLKKHSGTSPIPSHLERKGEYVELAGFDEEWKARLSRLRNVRLPQGIQKILRMSHSALRIVNRRVLPAGFFLPASRFR